MIPYSLFQKKKKINKEKVFTNHKNRFSIFYIHSELPTLTNFPPVVCFQADDECLVIGGLLGTKLSAVVHLELHLWHTLS